MSFPGNGELKKPTCPPCAGNSNATAHETSVAEGKTDEGINGSLRALITSVGTWIYFNQGLLLDRVQYSSVLEKPCNGAVTRLSN